jgi:sulfofructose kinase
MEKLDIVGLGLSTVDILLRLDEMPTWVDISCINAIKVDGGGPVGTAMVACARLGANVGYVGTTGNDDLGTLKMNFFTREGIDTSRVMLLPMVEPHIIIVYVQEATGERAFASCANWLHDQLDPDKVDREYITQASYLHLDGCYHRASMEAANWMHAAGKKVVLDASKTNHGSVGQEMRDLVGRVDYLICGSGFSRALTGIQDVAEAGKAVLEMGPQVFVETLGAEGSITVTREEQFRTPSFKVEVVDTTGAGDVFHGAYIVGLLHGWDLHRVAQFSSAVSALKCRSLGGRAGIPRFQDVISFLKEQNCGFQE